jgi:hypothetical protein
MKFFTIYNQQTGEINNSGSCLDIDIQIVPDGCLIAEIESNPLTQYIKNNCVKDIPLKPNFECEFNFLTESWVPSNEKQSSFIKFQRKLLLTNSDWTQIQNNPLTIEQQESWADYRQQLRDITSQPGYPFNVIWPTPPQG